MLHLLVAEHETIIDSRALSQSASGGKRMVLKLDIKSREDHKSQTDIDMDFLSNWWVVFILSGIGAIALNLISAYLKPVTDALFAPVSAVYNVRTLTRRIRENEELKRNIQNLATSDRALLTMGLHRLFVLLAMFSVIFAIENFLDFLAAKSPTWLINSVRVLVWLLPAAAATEVVRTLQQVADYPASAEGIERRTEQLRRKLAERQTAGQ
jgi:hypothetical protein